MKTVIITGGTGLVGTRLTEMLLASKAYKVVHFSRSSKKTHPLVEVCKWDVERGEIDEQAFLEADYLIHLAGANVGDKAWIETRKREILDSRTYSTQLLEEKIRKLSHRLKAFISTSAIGYYGYKSGDQPKDEQGRAGDDFLAQVCVAWEKPALQVREVRTAILRIGIVLSEKGGALEAMRKPIALYAGAALGSGKQWVSWIHLDDLCRFFIFAMENESVKGIYNAVAPNPVTNEELTKIIAKTLHKPLFLPAVPEAALYLLLGEQAQMPLSNIYASHLKMAETGFEWEYEQAQKAVQNLLGKR
ncbi:TIGR01777 family oxidoreductase [Hugenholtzia roseola]|uniref:TIGR01777 family oxidoreductase n=1 Tax=Hugenholtzia roseola TaxID=1002 RepID=UPI000557E8D1|nr:TIGR01777 family oxidoreductase [Hugenholtzia roseola]